MKSRAYAALAVMCVWIFTVWFAWMDGAEFRDLRYFDARSDALYFERKADRCVAMNDDLYRASNRAAHETNELWELLLRMHDGPELKVGGGSVDAD